MNELNLLHFLCIYTHILQLQLMLSDPNDNELYQMLFNVATGEWEPLTLDMPKPEGEDEPDNVDPTEFFGEPLLTGTEEEETQIDRSTLTPLPKEGFV